MRRIQPRIASRLRSPPRDGNTVAGRPFVNFTLALNRGISGTEVWSYHALNLLIHVSAGLALPGFLRRTTNIVGRRLIPTSVAFSAALIWLVHPLQTSAVTYIVQRAESLMVLCVRCAFS